MRDTCSNLLKGANMNGNAVHSKKPEVQDLYSLNIPRLPERHSKLFFFDVGHFFVPFSVKMITYCFNNVEARARGRPLHD